LGGGLVGGVGMLGFAVSLFLPLTAVGVGCLGSSCLAIATGGVLATVGAVKNGDAAEKRRGAARLRSDGMAY
jgi:hypothetical protein